MLTGCAGVNDWSYELPNGYEVWRINSNEIIVKCVSDTTNNGIVKICAVKKYPKFDFATYRTSIAVTTINSFLEFCQGRRRRLF